ncbi:MAG: transglutaminase-like domain-containing protein [Candidatus Thermoplasmatota archaeon]|nr:transglutaminase-like domain-containing protein [Candidatus Thermoplasmatota archaeon]
MNNKIWLFRIAVLLLLVGLSGCNEVIKVIDTDPVIERANPYLDKIVMNDIDLRAYANSIIGECSTNNKECQVNAIYRHLVENYNYVSDPEGVELIQTPEETIQINGGDCEDLTILLISLLENIGIKTYLVLTDTHAYSLAYDINSNDLWNYVEPSLINQVEKDWGENIRQSFKQTFVLKGNYHWYYGGDGSSMVNIIDYLNISYSINSDRPLHLYIVPSGEDYDKLVAGESFMHYPDYEKENILKINDSFGFLFSYGGIILSNENYQDATVEVDIEFYFKPSFYGLFGDEKIISYNIGGADCVVLDPTAGLYGFPGYDAEILGEKVAIDLMTKEYTYLR